MPRRNLSNAFGSAILPEAAVTVEIVPDGYFYNPKYSNPVAYVGIDNFPGGSLEPDDILKLTTGNPRASMVSNTKLKEVLLHAAILRGKYSDITRSGYDLFKSSVLQTTEELKEIGLEENAKHLARSFTTSYCQDKSRWRVKSDHISRRRCVRWARDQVSSWLSEDNDDLYKYLRFHEDSFWQQGTYANQRDGIKELRYVMFCRDFEALQIALEAYPISKAWWADESSIFTGVISMAILTDFWDGLKAVIDAGAPRSDCLYWAIDLGSDIIVERMAGDGITVLDSFEARLWMKRMARPLEKAIEDQHVKIVECLLFNGATILPHDFHLSLQLEDSNIASILVGFKELDFWLNVRDVKNRTPLSYAAEKGHDVIVRLLLENQANVEAKDRLGQTPLSLAAEKGRFDTIQALLAAGASVNNEDKYQTTPLHWAAKNGHVRAMQALLDAGASVDARDKYQKTPLHWAARNGHISALQILLAAKASVKSRDKFQTTPLHWAAWNGDLGAMQALKAGPPRMLSTEIDRIHQSRHKRRNYDIKVILLGKSIHSSPRIM
jgi:hypothetical protein